MSKSVDIFMPIYIGDYLKKTSLLSCEEHGAYFLMLCTLWQHGGYLPMDNQKLSRVCHLSIDSFISVWSNISEFFEVSEGKISNKRVLEEILNAEKRKERAIENGMKGGRPSKEPRNNPAGYPDGLLEHNQNHNLNESSSPSPSPSPSTSKAKSTKKYNSGSFVAPSLADVVQYCKERKYNFFDCEKYYTLRTDCEWVKQTGAKVINWKNDITTANSFGSFQRKKTDDEIEREEMEAFALKCAKDVKAG